MGRANFETTAGKLGRPAAFTREQAIFAAMNLFWQKGFMAVSAMELAQAMGIQRSSFYNSFGNRERVFKEALAVYAEQAPDAPLDHIQPGEPVISQMISVLRNVCRVRASDTQARGCLVCNSVAELVGVDDKIGPLLEAALAKRTARLEALLKQAIQQQELDPVPDMSDVPNMACAFTAFLLGINTLSKVIRDEAKLWAACRQFLLGLGVSAAILDEAQSL